MDGLRKKGIVGGKLRWNAVLNGASMRGTYYGNTAGTLGTSSSVVGRSPESGDALRPLPGRAFFGSAPRPRVADLTCSPCPAAFLYNVFNNIVPRARPDNKQDIYTSVASGALAGALFKSTGSSAALRQPLSFVGLRLTPRFTLAHDRSWHPPVFDRVGDHGRRRGRLELRARCVLEVGQATRGWGRTLDRIEKTHFTPHRVQMTSRGTVSGSAYPAGRRGTEGGAGILRSSAAPRQSADATGSASGSSLVFAALLSLGAVVESQAGCDRRLWAEQQSHEPSD
jgi:hypothetical protein